jgi:hypothetical protein
MISAGGRAARPRVRPSIGLSAALQSFSPLTGVFFLGLPILDRIESPTATVILRLYSDNDIDSAPAASDVRIIVHAMTRTCTSRSDQPISCASLPSMSPSTHLLPFEHGVAAASRLRATAPLPLVHTTGFQCAFLGAYVAGGHAAALTCVLQLCRPFGV